jgi:uncharacterized protein (TIGR03643 family)
MNQINYPHSEAEVDRIIQMAWEDRTAFDSIEAQFGIKESQVIRVMRNNLKPSSFKLWRKRVSGRKTKHLMKRSFKLGRFHCPDQKS